jgi:hypothetical protein
MPATPTKQQVVGLLVASPWFHPNKDKKTSTWESHLYSFAEDGTVTITGDLAANPAPMAWKVVRAGSRPIVQIGKRRLTLERCVRMDKSPTLCLFGKPPA